MTSSKNLAGVVKNIKQKASCTELFKAEFPDHYKGRSSKCPFHDDHRNSLEVHDDHVFCHSGCRPANGSKSFDQISLYMQAKGCDFPSAVRQLATCYGIPVEPVEKPKKRHQAPTDIYPYREQDGTVRYEVCRFDPKDFRQRRPDGNGRYIWNLNGVQRLLYRLPDIVTVDTVWITEGEKDADSLHALGLCGTTAPQGAGKWSAVCQGGRPPEALKEKHVIILPDNDEPGEKHADDIARSLHGFTASVKILRLPGLPEKGDVSDFIQQHGPEEAKRLLLELATGAPEYQPKGSTKGPVIVSCSDLLSQELPPPQWIIHEVLTVGLALLIGKPKMAKSWLVQALLLAVARGSLALGHFPTEQATALSLCLEDNDRRMRDRLLTLLQGEPAPNNHLLTWQWPQPFDKGIDQLHKILEADKEIRLVAIDTWGRFRGRKNHNEDAYSGDYSDLAQLHSLTSLYNVAILLVHHARKASSDDEFDSALGSTALTGAVDTLLSLKRANRHSPEGVLYVAGRDVPDAQYGLTFDNGIWSYAGDPAEAKLSAERREIRQILRDAGVPLGIEEIKAAMNDTKAYAAVKQLVYRMTDKGELVKAVGSRGKYLLPAEDAHYAPVYGAAWDLTGGPTHECQ